MKLRASSRGFDRHVVHGRAEPEARGPGVRDVIVAVVTVSWAVAGAAAGMLSGGVLKRAADTGPPHARAGCEPGS